MIECNCAFECKGQKFTYREAQIILCYARGFTAKQTADLLSISYSTAKTHREHIRDRFELRGHNALYRFALEQLPKLEKSVTLPID